MERVESILQQGWHDLPEGREFIGSILRRGRRRIFGKALKTRIILYPRPSAQAYLLPLFIDLGIVSKSLVGRSNNNCFGNSELSVIPLGP